MNSQTEKRALLLLVLILSQSNRFHLFEYSNGKRGERERSEMKTDEHECERLKIKIGKHEHKKYTHTVVSHPLAREKWQNIKNLFEATWKSLEGK
jgi:peptidyl-tRNA hydrolase